MREATRSALVDALVKRVGAVPKSGLAHGQGRRPPCRPDIGPLAGSMAGGYDMHSQDDVSGRSPEDPAMLERMRIDLGLRLAALAVGLGTFEAQAAEP